jgi:hypothetical protein
VFLAAEQFPREAKMAESQGELKPHVGQRVEAQWKGKWYKAKVIDTDGSRSKVSYVGFGSDWDEWLPSEKVRRYKPLEYPVGTEVQVRWSDGKWYPAKVQRAWFGLHFIRYDGYDATWDEWVGPGAIRVAE